MHLIHELVSSFILYAIMKQRDSADMASCDINVTSFYRNTCKSLTCNYKSGGGANRAGGALPHLSFGQVGQAQPSIGN